MRAAKILAEPKGLAAIFEVLRRFTRLRYTSADKMTCFIRHRVFTDSGVSERKIILAVNAHGGRLAN